MAIKGLMFDFDGLIIDTEMPGCNAWAEVFNQYGFSFTIDNWKRTIGTGPTAYNPAVHLSELTEGKVDARKIGIQTMKRTRELIDMQPMLPGVIDFLNNAKELKIPMVMASSSNRSWVEGYLAKLGIRQYFEAVCTSDDVKNVKPDPELYVLAASKIGLSPSQTIAFEDSPNGIRAAKEAGAYCIAIPNEITITMDLSLADRVQKSFIELDLKQLLN